MHSELKNETRHTWARDDISLINSNSDISTQSASRMMAVLNAVRYISNNNIKGDIVECGVYLGITPFLCATECKKLNDNKHIWSYDTFEGIQEEDIGDNDIDHNNKHAKEYFDDSNGKWCACSLENVKKNVQRANYSEELLHYIKGPVQETIPKFMPESISFLRLDMDLDIPTRHAINFLWDRVTKYGIIQVDDNGYFKGVKDVIDEFVANKHVYIHEIDYTGISIIKFED